MIFAAKRQVQMTGVERDRFRQRNRRVVLVVDVFARDAKVDANGQGDEEDDDQNRIDAAAGETHSVRSALRRQRRASSTTDARYGRIRGMPMSGGRKLRVEISTPIAAADSGAMYDASSTTSATSRVPSPATVSGNWPAMSAMADRLAHAANGTLSESATVKSQI